MTLSAPIFRLKRLARLRARQQSIPLHAALDDIATQHGFTSWSLLASRHAEQSEASKLLSQCAPGELLLLAARPRQGKTVLALQMALEAIENGHEAHVFTLDYTRQQVLDRLAGLGAEADAGLQIDCSDAICADHIINALRDAATGAFVVIDYLQLLDQRRDTPPLQQQVEALAAFAYSRNLTMAFICQIDRGFDEAAARHPDMADIRLPNPLDLGLFSRAAFLHAGTLRWTGLLAPT